MDVISLYFAPRGRITRRVWWCHGFVLLPILAFTGILTTAFLSGVVGFGEDVLPTITFVWLVVAAWCWFALAVKRLHDHSRSAWFILTALVPIVGVVILFMMLGFSPTTSGRNKYGHGPSDPTPEISTDDGQSTVTVIDQSPEDKQTTEKEQGEANDGGQIDMVSTNLPSPMIDDDGQGPDDEQTTDGDQNSEDQANEAKNEAVGTPCGAIGCAGLTIAVIVGIIVLFFVGCDPIDLSCEVRANQTWYGDPNELRDFMEDCPGY